jgi:exopolysaccharide production protein ExoQ
VKYRTDLRRADQSAGPLSSALRVNTSRSHARSGSRIALYAAAVFFFLQSMSALGIIDRSVYGEWYGKTGDKITLTLNLLGIFTSLFLFWSGARGIRRDRFNRAIPLAAASLLLISVLWSVDPRMTLTQGAAYFFVVLGAIGLVDALDGDELMDLVALICFLSAVASVIFPETRELDEFRGIFPQKNVLGQVMAAGVLTSLHGARGGRWLRSICIIVLCTIVAFMSKSATSLMTILIFFLLWTLGKLYLRGGSTRLISICFLIACVPVIIFFVTNPDLIFELIGKESTLTGRTKIWPYVIDSIGDKPLLGWGFCAFWSTLNPVLWQIIVAMRGDDWFTPLVVNAHNGILEFLLEIGFLGTSFFLFLLVRNFVMAVKCMNGPAKQLGLSSVLLLTGILVIGFSEEVLLSAGQIWTSLFFMMGFMCEKKLWLARARSQGRVRPPRRQLQLG